jgi:hypothetical protein
MILTASSWTVAIEDVLHREGYDRARECDFDFSSSQDLTLFTKESLQTHSTEQKVFGNPDISESVDLLL